MGKYCDICKADDEKQYIETFECDVYIVDWCTFKFHVCRKCAEKIRLAIENIKGEHHAKDSSES